MALAFVNAGEAPRLEERVNGVPKDILLRDGSVHIECKSFCPPVILQAVYENHRRLFEKLDNLDSGDWIVDLHGRYTKDYFDLVKSESVHLPNPKFTIRKAAIEDIRLRDVENARKHGVTEIEFTMSECRDGRNIVPVLFLCFPGNINIKFIGPTLDLSGAIMASIRAKNAQLLQGRCNILAINVSCILGDYDLMLENISASLDPAVYNLLAGILLVRNEGNECQIIASLVRAGTAEGTEAGALFDALPKVGPKAKD